MTWGLQDRALVTLNGRAVFLFYTCKYISVLMFFNDIARNNLMRIYRWKYTNFPTWLQASHGSDSKWLVNTARQILASNFYLSPTTFKEIIIIDSIYIAHNTSLSLVSMRFTDYYYPWSSGTFHTCPIILSTISTPWGAFKQGYPKAHACLKTPYHGSNCELISCLRRLAVQLQDSNSRPTCYESSAVTVRPHHLHMIYMKSVDSFW